MMEGGTTYHFVTDGIHVALKRATEAANDKDIRLAGGVATIRQYLEAGLIDQLHLAIAPIMLGSGEPLLSGIDMLKLGYVLTEHVQTAKATHIILTKHKPMANE
jgi:dihydrofolate reductase